ncbi:MAG: glycoside hydrolase family 16 protein [Fibrobacter sp.]|nr:glycoside hydrolase family 16 protein [Fibrobacter sp.]
MVSSFCRRKILHYGMVCMILCFGFIGVSGETMVWNDEFSGSSIDTTRWSFDLGTGAPELTGWGNNELQYYTSNPTNVSIVNDKLCITAIKESYQGCAYTSARIQTKLKGDWTYGRFEIKAKLPKGKGIWPAIWMLPTDNFYGGWASSGEIDIMEFLGHEPAKIHGTIHFGGVWPDNQSSTGTYTLPQGDFSDDFHIFAIEWDPEGISWYVDSIRYSVKPHKQPFDKRFYLIMNLAVGGNWPGNPDGSTVFPARMEVDYVRVYASPTAIRQEYRRQRILTKQQTVTNYSTLLNGKITASIQNSKTVNKTIRLRP